MKSKIAIGFFVQITAISLIVLFTNHFIENQTLVSWIIIGIAILTTTPLGFVFFRSINNQHIEYLELADKSSELEYLVSYQQKKAEDKLLDLAEKVSEISNMLGYTSGYLDTLTNQTEINVKEITNAFRQVVNGTNQEDESIQQISEQLQAMIVAINGVANGAQEQANAIQETSNITDGVSQLIRDITSSVQVATESSVQAAKAAQEGGKTISETVESILSIKAKVDESAERVSDMNNRSEEINVIVEKIKDIAAQTDLLALNAAIEAARAGEMGRGFSVVASEVRKLSEYSLEAAQEVSDLIEAIQLSAQAAVKSMALGVSEVEKGVGLANQSGAALTSIIQATEVAVQEAQSVVHLTEQQLEMSSKLGSAIESVSAVVEENAASTEEMTAGSDDISNEMQNISEVSARNRIFANNVEQSIGKIVDLVADETASAQTLAEMASSLQNLIARFSYDADSKSEINRSTSKLITPTIGVILPTMSNLFWQNSVDFAKRGAAELGINLLIRDSKDNPELMQEYILEMVSGKVDGFLLVPYWGIARKALELAREKNIPVMLLDSYQSGLQPQSDEFPNYLAFIGPADETGAYEMGKQLLETISRNGKHKRVIAALDGPQEAASAIIRHKGLARALKEFPEVNLIASEIADYELIKAEERTYQLLNDHPEISGIWAANDMMAQGAIKAAKKIGRKPGHDLYVVGMDLDEVSIQAVRSGEQQFDIGGHWLQFGFGLSILFDHINGYSLPKGRSIIKLKLLPLTIDKVSQFEKDYPNGLPTYDFRDKSRAYNPKAPISFFEMDYSNS